jgi:hypothetical protein
MCDALHANGDAFLRALAAEAELDVKDRGFRYAIILLMNKDVLTPAIANPSMTTFAQSLRLTRCMLDLDSNFVNALLRALLTRQDMKDPACTLRVLDIISECASHLANWRSLARIHQDGDARVKRKCATLLARFRFDDRAGLDLFRRSDPRVRANIIQTIWDAEQAKVDALLGVAIHDEDNRVAGNACLALYNAGGPRSLARLATLLDSAEPKDRITAAWVLCRCRDGRFANRLLDASRSSVPALKRMAIAGLSRLQAIVLPEQSSQPSPMADITPSLISVPEAADELNGKELWLRVADQGDEFQSGIRAIDFLFWAGEEYLLDYSVQLLDTQGETTLRIVIPACHDVLEQGLRAAVAAKPASQSWAVCAYGRSDKPATDDSLRLETDSQVPTARFDSGLTVLANTDEAVNAVLSVDSTIPDQHLVLVLDGQDAGPAPEAIRALCREKKIRLHCWRLQAYSGGRDGLSGFVRDEAATASSLPLFVKSLQRRYTVHSKELPTAVAIRDSTAAPVRFSLCHELSSGAIV